MATSEQTSEYGAIVGGRTLLGGEAYEIRSPYDGAAVAVVRRAGRADVEGAIAGAVRAFEITRKLPSWRREEILLAIAAGIAARRDELARTIALEAGKPIKAARIEADRAVFTFKVAAEESKRIYGELVPLDWLPGLEGRSAQVRRVPLGPIAGISPFNFPLNLVAHKVAPALAAGCPIVLRPASQTPLSALKLAEIVLEAGWPEDGFAVVPSSTADAAPLVEDDRIKLLTFTGSPAVGWSLKPRAGRKRVTLELGGNAAVIVHADADRDYAAERITWGATVQAGQTCISVQRVYAHESLGAFAEELASRFERLVVGDPLDDATDVGPLIDTEAADRVEAWLAEAVDEGATLLTGGTREGNTIAPAVLTGLREEMKISCEEAFAPVVGVYRYTDVGDAIAAAGNSEFGLQGALADLLSGISVGVYVPDARGVDFDGGRLRMAAEDAHMIRGGEIAEPVQDVVVRGAAAELLQGVDGVAADFAWSRAASACTSGCDGLVHVGDGAPHVRIRAARVDGEGG